MERKTSRNLYLTGLVLAIIATVLFIVAGGTAAATANPDGTLNTGAGAGLGVLVLVAIVGYIIAAILGTIAWIGALIKTARLGQWVWFVLLLLLGGIPMLIYIFAGPTEAKAAM